MMQLLHIFRKDVRHQWKDLAVYALLLLCFAVVTPQAWSGVSHSNSIVAGLVGILLKVQIPILWLVMIARLVHDECLVGDQQFWVTRPYGRGSLLGAKLLFVALCIVVPFVSMQWALVLRAGLNPLAAIPGLLQTLLYFVLIVWLPFLAVATVTRGVGSAFLALLMTVVGWAMILISFSGDLVMRTLPLHLSAAVGFVAAVSLTAVLVYQYSTLHTERSRVALLTVAAALLLWFCSFSSPGFVRPVNAMIRHQHPMETGSPLRLVLDTSVGTDARQIDRTTPKGLVALNLPLHLEGLESEARLRRESLMFTLDGANSHYETPWRDVIVSDDGIGVMLPSEVLDKMRGEKVRLHIELAAERLTPNAPQTVVAADYFKVPDNGVCVLDVTKIGSNNMSCRYAFVGPPPTRVSGMVQQQPCSVSGKSQPSAANLISTPAATKPDPLVEEQLSFGGAVCPGTMLTFVSYRSDGEFRVETDVPEVVLDAYIVR